MLIITLEFNQTLHSPPNEIHISHLKWNQPYSRLTRKIYTKAQVIGESADLVELLFDLFPNKLWHFS